MLVSIMLLSQDRIAIICNVKFRASDLKLFVGDVSNSLAYNTLLVVA